MEHSTVVYVAVLCLLLNPEYCAPQLRRNRTNRPPRCHNGLFVKCNMSREKPVWAKANSTQTGQCMPFLNRCVFNSANCLFFYKNLPRLVEISRVECEEMCHYECPTPELSETHVCAYRAGERRKFASVCELHNHSCKTGEIWSQSFDLDLCD